MVVSDRKLSNFIGVMATCNYMTILCYSCKLSNFSHKYPNYQISTQKHQRITLCKCKGMGLWKNMGLYISWGRCPLCRQCNGFIQNSTFKSISVSPASLNEKGVVLNLPLSDCPCPTISSFSALLPSHTTYRLLILMRVSPSTSRFTCCKFA